MLYVWLGQTGLQVLFGIGPACVAQVAGALHPTGAKGKPQAFTGRAQHWYDREPQGGFPSPATEWTCNDLHASSKPAPTTRTEPHTNRNLPAALLTVWVWTPPPVASGGGVTTGPVWPTQCQTHLGRTAPEPQQSQALFKVHPDLQKNASTGCECTPWRGGKPCAPGGKNDQNGQQTRLPTSRE